MNIPDAYSHPLFNPEIDRETHYHTRNILCTAIKDMSGRTIAVVQVCVGVWLCLLCACVLRRWCFD